MWWTRRPSPVWDAPPSAAPSARSRTRARMSRRSDYAGHARPSSLARDRRAAAVSLRRALAPAWRRTYNAPRRASFLTRWQDGDPYSRAARMASMRKGVSEPPTTVRPTLSEAELIERAKAGDREAFDALRGMHQRAVYGCIRARTRNSPNEADAQDLQQDAWLEVFQHIECYDPARAPFLAFARYWAGIVVARFYGDPWRTVVLIDTLLERHPRLAEVEVWDVIANRRPRAGRAVRKKPGPAEGAKTPRASPTAGRARRDDGQDLATLDAALKNAFTHPIPPHQYLAFGFVELLAWKPREVAAELSVMPLQDLAQRLEDDYHAESHLPGGHARPSFAALRECMPPRFRDLPLDPNTRKTFAHERYGTLLDRIVGLTVLQDYCRGTAPEGGERPVRDGGGNRSRKEDGESAFAQCISHWWFAVARRAKKTVGRAGSSPPHA